MVQKIVIIVSTAQIVSLLVGLIIVLLDKKVCLTEKCQQLVDTIKNQIDVKVNPCENFYDFACGKLLYRDESEKIEDLGISSQNEESEIRRMKILLAEAPKSDEPKTFQKVKTLYRLCREQKLNSQAARIRSLFGEVGGFPTLEGDSWDEESWSLIETIKKMRLKGFSTNVLFSLTYGFNPLELNQVSLYTLNPDVSKSYVFTSGCEDCKANFITQYVRIVASLNGDEDKAAADAEDLYPLTSGIVLICRKFPDIDRIKPLALKNQVKSISTLASNYSFFDWKEYIKIMLQMNSDPSDEFVVVVRNPRYLRELNSMLSNTPKRTLANYMIWMNLDIMYSFSANKRRRDTCFTLIENKLLFALQAMYVHTYYYDHIGDAKLVKQMFETIKRQAMSTISKADWMDSRVRQDSEAKVKAIDLYLGFTEELSDIKLLEKRFENLEVTNNFLDSILNVIKFRMDVMSRSVGKTADKKFWKIAGLQTEALYSAKSTFYNFEDNSLWVAPGVLQLPVFDEYWPESVNYGRVGYLIGHEFTHAFDASGREVDKDGKTGLWWDPLTSTRYSEKTQCFIKQYSNFTILNLVGELERMDGREYVDENIADGTGIKLAFEAYRAQADSNLLSETRLPGIDFTSEQIFFISMAHYGCNKYEEEKFSVMTCKLYSPYRYRVIGSLQNLPQFSEVFNCKSGSKMNPVNKCVMW
ncbi:neprilysin-2-like [Homalodisca vitripennis]|uniref:neprilysin-2-like n=1 Tax=Homalodisca vitripennis TaxID=197043 RepID=UPI001EEBFBEA|nr:neprilysin-2-like [Homalodisca vitripennis]KAG8287669.1 NEDD8 protease nep2 [Homalodisca vitripennis]